MRSARQFRRSAEEAYRQAELVKDVLAEAASTTLGEVAEPDHETAQAAGGG